MASSWPTGTPTSYKEWQLAGGEAGTGMSYAEWVKRESSVVSQSQLNKFAAAGVPVAVAEQIQLRLNEGYTLEEIRQELAQAFGKEKGYSYLDRFMDVVEGRWKASSLGDILESIIGS